MDLKHRKIALYYPEPKEIGLSNLAVHFFTHAFFGKCDFDIFFHDSDLSLFNGRKAQYFDIILVSLSYEYSYLNLAQFFVRNKIPLRKEDRVKGPMVIGGGVALMLNPAPLTRFFDIILAGEAECMIGDLFNMFSQNYFEDVLAAASGLDYSVMPHRTAEVVRAQSGQFAVYSHPELHKLGNGFGNRLIIELNRGCAGRCRFCAASYIYKTYRQADMTRVMDIINNLPQDEKGAALMGTSLDCVEGFGVILEALAAKGKSASVSSVRIKGISDLLAMRLKACGVLTVTMAVESADSATRKAINKAISDDEIFAAADILEKHGLKPKFYFIAGLPDTDVTQEAEAVVDLMKRLLVKYPAMRAALSFAPFSPKAATPFALKPMMSRGDYKKFTGIVRKGLRQFSGQVKPEFFSYGESVTQAYFGRSDETLLDFLESYAKDGSDFIEKELISIEKVMTQPMELKNAPWVKLINSYKIDKNPEFV